MAGRTLIEPVEPHMRADAPDSHSPMPGRACRTVSLAMALIGAVTLVAQSGQAQGLGGWETDLNAPPAVSPPKTATPPPTDITKTPTPHAPSGKSKVRLLAFLTADGQQIDRGIVWRVFGDQAGKARGANLISTHRSASPVVKLEAGSYVVNAAFGRAHLTRKITVDPGAEATEQFVINAGGLRIKAITSDGQIPAKSVTYDIWEGERDQSGNRALVMSKAQADLIIRLNAGIYHLVSTYGKANAKVTADVTVEAGKLTEATIQHLAARVTFKLVDRRGGEAIPGTRWQIQTMEGKKVKNSVGALPTHVLAPGNYIATAQIGGQLFRREFSVSDGDRVQVEVLKTAATAN